MDSRSEVFRARHEKIRARMREEGFDALIVYSNAKARGCVRYIGDYFVRAVGAQTRPDGSYYSFGNCAVLFPLEGEPVLVTDQPWDIGRATELSIFEETYYQADIGADFAARIAEAGYQKVGIDNWFIFPAMHYLPLLATAGRTAFVQTMLIEDTYRVKGPDEIEMIRASETIGVHAVMAGMEAVHVGAAEHEFAMTAESVMRVEGDLELAASSIVTGGGSTRARRAACRPTATPTSCRAATRRCSTSAQELQGYAGDMSDGGRRIDERPRSRPEEALRRHARDERGGDRDDRPRRHPAADERRGLGGRRRPRLRQVQDPAARPQPRPRYPRPAGLLLRRLPARRSR